MEEVQVERFFIARKRTVLMVLTLLVGASACSGPSGATREGPRAPDPEPPEEEGGPVTRTVRGYRIQIFTTPERSAANERVEAALQWWRQVPASERPAYLAGGDELFVEVIWRAPYYRVQLGKFADRAEAQEALAAVQARFADAFLVPGTVTITR